MIFDLARSKRMFFLFLIGLGVFALLFVGYDIIYVDKTTTRSDYNLQAFPKVQPKDLPDADISLSKCMTEIKSCRSDYDCQECTSEEDTSGKFKCTNVQRDGQYEMNGVRLPKGDYCLPRTDTAKKCNRYTGKWVWSTSSDCPPDENGVFSSQCWKCVCLYPDLFYDETDCSTQIACVNTSDKTSQSAEKQRKRNRLVGAPYSEYAGQYWDPNASDSIDSSVLDANPYSTDTKGRPKFYCDCDARDGRNQKEFLTLPNDPYTCHVDMCYNVNQKLSTTYSCKNSANQPCNPFETPENCTCACNCGLNSSVTRSNGTCQVYAGMCNPGRINDTFNGCACGIYKKRICRSNVANTTNASLPECKDNNNPFGEECVDQCNPNPCTPGASCKYSNVSDDLYECDCSTANNRPTFKDALNQDVKWIPIDNKCSGYYAAPGTPVLNLKRAVGFLNIGVGKDTLTGMQMTPNVNCRPWNTGAYSSGCDAEYVVTQSTGLSTMYDIRLKCPPANMTGKFACNNMGLTRDTIR